MSFEFSSVLGKVYIVGAGPGDADLLTLKAYKILKEADVILYDRLIGEDIVKMIKDLGKKAIYVGKEKGEKSSIRQMEINKLMKKYAERGKTVVRLKGGDPLIFGRLAEEIEFLIKNGIPFEVIPGVSSVNGVPAYANIPLTHPEFGLFVVVLSGRESARLNEVLKFSTFVVLMAGSSAKNIAQNMINAGMDPKTSVAIIQRGTMSNQKVRFFSLDELSKSNFNFEMPAMMIVGKVVELAKDLQKL
ncbi:uroporphyrinogen-III C-methyltransferase [Archaeoglobales archaeon]|nr:MAG: uroporphyrinogen-III C-methyltransferase [Archaeoglobales archaeon]